VLYQTVSKELAHSQKRYSLHFVIIHGHILEISWDISEVGSYNILSVSEHEAGADKGSTIVPKLEIRRKTHRTGILILYALIRIPGR
jgi:hypothetical protein